MKRTIIAIIATLAIIAPAQAQGFGWFFAHVKPTGACGLQREVAVSFYDSGRRTANGEAFHPGGHTAAHRSLPFGTVVHIHNPRTKRSVSVRINDRGPWGPAHNLGVKFDLARGAAASLGMSQTGWVCVSRT